MNNEIQKRSVVNINEKVYEKIKKFCEKRSLKISNFVEDHFDFWIDEQEKNACTCIIQYHGPQEDLKKLNKDKKVKINGWGGHGNYLSENFFCLSTHFMDRREELLMDYIIEYVKKHYPSLSITKMDYYKNFEGKYEKIEEKL